MKHLPTPIPYRQDINGLRAWAVIAVLLFHFKIPGVSAGFIGVDVFFVISGYLMTAIIVKGLEGQNFSIWKFYLARVRRIVPALIVLVAVLLILGWFWLPTPDYQSLGTQSAYSLAFLSNIHYWRATGYFDVAAQEKWLLHTWSLGIEAQFYILYPIFLMILWKIKPQIKTLFWGLIFAFTASLALSIGVSHLKPAAAFYLLPTRGWELAAGGLAFLIGREVASLQRFAKPMFWLGFALWWATVFMLDSEYAWPSGWALMPVVGTVLIILSHQHQAKLMVNPIAQWLGYRSYSLYLWHWPLMVALYFAGLQNEWLWVAGAIGLSILLAHLSFQIVEVPTRLYLLSARIYKQVIFVGLAGLVIGLTAVSMRLMTFENRLPPEIEIAAAEATNTEPRSRGECAPTNDNRSPSCVYGNKQVGAILMGDSHAMSTVTSLALAGSKVEKGALFLGKSGCATIKDIKRSNNDCFDYNNWLLEEKLIELSGMKVPILLVSRTSVYVYGHNEDEQPKPIAYFDKPLTELATNEYLNQFKQSYIDTACLIQGNHQTYVMRPIPEMGVDVPKTLSKNIMFGRGNEDIKITLEEYHQRHSFVWEAQDLAAEQCGVKILNPLPYLCDDEYCYGSRNGRPLYYDDDHLSEYGNKYLIPMFEEVFRDQQ